MYSLIEQRPEEFFTGHAVYVRIYDISHGFAKVWSPLLIGQRIEGVWHTGVEVYGREYFYGGGVYKIQPGAVTSALGLQLRESLFMGSTECMKIAFERFVVGIADDFTPAQYHLLEWNCNHFTNEVVKFLVPGAFLPDRILNLPAFISRNLMGRLVLRIIGTLNRSRAPVQGVADQDTSGEGSDRSDSSLSESQSTRSTLPTEECAPRPFSRPLVPKLTIDTSCGLNASEASVVEYYNLGDRTWRSHTVEPLTRRNVSIAASPLFEITYGKRAVLPGT